MFGLGGKLMERVGDALFESPCTCSTHFPDTLSGAS
jgi:hypothetical protein